MFPSIIGQVTFEGTSVSGSMSLAAVRGAITTDRPVTFPRAGTVRDLSVWVDNAPGVYSFNKNGVASALQVTLSGTGRFEDLTNEISVVEGDTGYYQGVGGFYGAISVVYEPDGPYGCSLMVTRSPPFAAPLNVTLVPRGTEVSTGGVSAAVQSEIMREEGVWRKMTLVVSQNSLTDNSSYSCFKNGAVSGIGIGLLPGATGSFTDPSGVAVSEGDELTYFQFVPGTGNVQPRWTESVIERHTGSVIQGPKGSANTSSASQQIFSWSGSPNEFSSTQSSMLTRHNDDTVYGRLEIDVAVSGVIATPGLRNTTTGETLKLGIPASQTGRFLADPTRTLEVGATQFAIIEATGPSGAPTYNGIRFEQIASGESVTEKYKNTFSTTISAAIDDAITQIFVGDPLQGPPVGVFRARIEDEIVRVIGTSDLRWFVERGTEGTTAVAHNVDTRIDAILSDEGFRSLSTVANRSGFGEPDPTEREGALFLPSTGQGWRRSDGSIWLPWGPISNWTKPPTAGQFTWVNQGAATRSDANDAVILRAPADNIWNLRLLATPVTAPYRLTAGFMSSLAGSSSGAFGTCFRQTSDGRMSLFVCQQSYSTGADRLPVLRIHQFATPQYGSGLPYINRLNSPMIGPMWWMRLEDDGTNRHTAWSSDGRNFLRLHSIVRTDYLTPNQVCWFANGSLESENVVTLVSWKIE